MDSCLSICNVLLFYFISLYHHHHQRTSLCALTCDTARLSFSFQFFSSSSCSLWEKNMFILRDTQTWIACVYLLKIFRVFKWRDAFATLQEYFLSQNNLSSSLMNPLVVKYSHTHSRHREKFSLTCYFPFKLFFFLQIHKCMHVMVWRWTC